MSKEDMERYCDTKTYHLGSCEVGWGAVEVVNGVAVYKGCHDDPKEKNCRCLIATAKSLEKK